MNIVMVLIILAYYDYIISKSRMKNVKTFILADGKGCVKKRDRTSINKSWIKAVGFFFHYAI